MNYMFVEKYRFENKVRFLDIKLENFLVPI
jgi:hypothetical protein